MRKNPTTLHHTSISQGQGAHSATLTHNPQTCGRCDSKGFITLPTAAWSDHILWGTSTQPIKGGRSITTLCEDWITPCNSHRCQG